ncbi:unnamed protein product [Caenorhabditis auriculariae]|uniref:Uncharacterized protein n=1 Tax=Caenorhabditis auriculariae TaxID=2777116 RepID=A0A8S1HAF1_9PELO|nr:unnamed protein product [Caenorhabditis auriculariae]
MLRAALLFTFLLLIIALPIFESSRVRRQYYWNGYPTSNGWNNYQQYDSWGRPINLNYQDYYVNVHQQQQFSRYPSYSQDQVYGNGYRTGGYGAPISQWSYAASADSYAAPPVVTSTQRSSYGIPPVVIERTNYYVGIPSRPQTTTTYPHVEETTTTALTSTAVSPFDGIVDEITESETPQTSTEHIHSDDDHIPSDRNRHEEESKEHRNFEL